MKSNLILDTESYKSSHWLQYPPNTTGMYSSFESRGGRYGSMGFAPESACSPDTALELAMAAYQRAWLPGSVAIGVGLTAVVASTHEHLVEHRPVFTETATRSPLADLGAGAIFPGAFNPPHLGHLGAARACGEAAIFAITTDPPHKPPLTLAELLQRAKLLRGHRCVFAEGDALEFVDLGTRFLVFGEPLTVTS
jgi:hypothetical protein